MRDIKRIDKICDLLAKCGKKYGADMRFGQFLSNFLGHLQEGYQFKDLGFIEDDFNIGNMKCGVDMLENYLKGGR